MSQSGNDLFRFVSLRAPLDDLSIDPGEYVSDSIVLSRLQGIRVNSLTPQPEVLERLEGLPTLSEQQFDKLELERLAHSLYTDKPKTYKALVEATVRLGSRSFKVTDFASRSRFTDEYRKVFDSWLSLRLRDPRNGLLARHVRLIRAAYLAQRLLRDGGSLREDGAIQRILSAHCSLPAAWRAANYRQIDLRTRHSAILRGRSEAAESAVRKNIEQKRALWKQLAQQISDLEVIGSRAHREYFIWNRERTGAVEPGAERRERAALRPRQLDNSFYERLESRLAERQKTLLNSVVSRMPGGRPGDLDDLITGVNSIGVRDEANAICSQIQELEEQEQNALPVASPLPPERMQPSVKAVGWGDLVVARERLAGYRAREIAHIENILPGETKLREHERTSKTKEVVETETITETETELDSQTTDRYELQTQSQDSIQQNFSIQSGVNTSGRYGLTHVDTSLDAGFQQSKSESRGSAQNLAKEIVSKAVERTFESVRKLRRLTITEQIRELNRHRLSNAAVSGSGTQPDPISGMYLWLEKIHQVQLRHYGTRLLVEFHIPEPAVSLLQLGAMSTKKRRLPPFNLGAHDIHSGNYLCKAQQYGAQGIEPPPAPFIHVGFTWATAPNEDAEEWAEDTVAEMVAIPDGYRPLSGKAIVSAIKDNTEPLNIYMAVGGLGVIDAADANGLGLKDFEFDPIVPWPNGVPISLRAKGHFDKTMVAQVVLRCERTPEAMSKWQVTTWEKLRAGYEVLLRQVDRDTELEARVRNVFGAITGRPEAENRRIEQEELKKWAIKAMRLKPHNFNAIEQVGDFQEISPLNADVQAPIVRFFEEAFEWKQMSYFLYPYFWSRRESWKMRNNVSSTDPRHTAFLSAGAARVIVPVTPGYEARVLYYLESDPAMDELTRVDGSANGEMPEQTSFEDLWLELLIDRKAEVALGSGSLQVENGSVVVRINDDSNWDASERDVGRELYIDGELYTGAELVPPRESKLDRAFAGGTAPSVNYATGSVPYGPPWLVNVPTALVILDENRGRLDSMV